MLLTQMSVIVYCLHWLINPHVKVQDEVLRNFLYLFGRILCFDWPLDWRICLVNTCFKVRKKNESISAYNTKLLAFLRTTNKMQHYTTFFIVASALRVSSGFSAHHQELKNCTCSIGYLSNLFGVSASGHTKQV